MIVTFRNKYMTGLLAMASIAVGGCGDVGNAQKNEIKFNLNRAVVTTYAGRINLRAPDVPKLVPARFPRTRETTSGPFGTYVEKCDGMSASSGVGFTSRRFRSASNGDLIPHESVQSAVYVMASPEVAYRDVMAAMGSRGRKCLKGSVLTKDTVVKPEGTKVYVPELSMVEVSHVEWHVGRTIVYGLRTTARTSIGGPRTVGAPNYYEDVAAFTFGRVVILLQTGGSPQPFPAVEERRLLSVLYVRTVSAK